MKLLVSSVHRILILTVLPGITLAAAPSAVLALLASAPVGRILVVTSAADSGPGTLRQLLLDAANEDTITFDPAVFPPNSPATIAITGTACGGCSIEVFTDNENEGRSY